MYNPLGLTSRMHQISADHLEVSTNRVGVNPVGKHTEKNFSKSLGDKNYLASGCSKNNNGHLHKPSASVTGIVRLEFT